MKASINSLHHQDLDWLRELEFYKEEIAILTTRLEEVVTKNNDKAINASVEHFQNKFFLLREDVDTLKHDVSEREKGVENIARDKPEHITERFNNVKDDVHKRMKGLAHSIADIRFEFNKFLAENL